MPVSETRLVRGVWNRTRGATLPREEWAYLDLLYQEGLHIDHFIMKCEECFELHKYYLAERTTFSDYLSEWVRQLAASAPTGEGSLVTKYLLRRGPDQTTAYGMFLQSKHQAGQLG